MAESKYQVEMSSLVDELQYRIERLTVAKMDFEAVLKDNTVAPELQSKNRLDLDRIAKSLDDAKKAKEGMQVACCQQLMCEFTLRT